MDQKQKHYNVTGQCLTIADELANKALNARILQIAMTKLETL